MHTENSEKENIDSLRKKASFFDELSAHFYKCNFGTCSKSEIDLLMFHFYCELHRDQANDSYTMSKTLGITQERIRNFKVKEYLTFPREIPWKELFTEKLKHKIQYNEADKTVEIPVLDPTVFIEIEHQIETSGGYVRYLRNGKILSVTLLDFSRLLVEIDKDLPDKKRLAAQELIENAFIANKELTPVDVRDLLKKGIFHSIPALITSVISGGFAS